MIQSLTSNWKYLDYDQFIVLYVHKAMVITSLFRNDQRIPLVEVERAVLAGENSTILPDGRAVPIKTIAPDLSLDGYLGDKISVQDLQIQDQIGSGGFATIYKGSYTKAGVQVAIKKLSGTSTDAKSKARSFAMFRQEIIVHSTVSHPSIVKLYGAVLSPSFMMVLELIPCGTLFDLIHNWGLPITWPFRTKVALDIALGLEYLHG